MVPETLSGVAINKASALKHSTRWAILQSMKHRRKVRIDYFEMLALFADVNNTDPMIGERFGVSHQAIHELFLIYFADCLPLDYRVTAGRYKLRSKIRGEERALALQAAKEAARFAIPQQPFLRKVALSALEREYEVLQGHGSIDHRPLILNGWNCRTFLVTKTVMRQEKALMCARINPMRKTVEQSDYIVIGLEVPGFLEKMFILPSKVLLDSYGEEGTPSIVFYPPLLDLNSGYPRKLNWRLFEGEAGWKQLRVPKSAPAPLVELSPVEVPQAA